MAVADRRATTDQPAAPVDGPTRRAAVRHRPDLATTEADRPALTGVGSGSAMPVAGATGSPAITLQ